MRRTGLLVLAVALLAACTRAPMDDATIEPVRAEPTMQPDDMVDLTVYFRTGEGDEAFLAPVTRETGIDEDLPRRAIELLIAGPSKDDGRDLAAPLPPSTQVRQLRIDGDIAHLDLSHHVITDSEDVNPSPENEALALAAIAGTLAEFPVIEQVRLSVEGAQTGMRDGVDIGAFWGGWGLPEVLVPDDSLLTQPAEGEGLPDLERFTREAQEVGSSTDARLGVTRVRPRDRTTYLRIVVEVEDLADPDSAAAIPPARAHPAGGTVVLEIEGIAQYDADFSPGQRIELEGPAFDGVEVETDDAGRVRIIVSHGEARDFLLHTLSSPTRLVLDVKK